MGVSESILKLAAAVEPDLGGVDWAALEAQLKVPREEVVYHTGVEVSDSGAFMYVAYLQAAHDRAWKALQDAGIVLSWGVEDDPATAENEVLVASKAWDSVQRETLDVSDIALQAIESHVAYLNPEDAMQLDKEKLRATVSSVFMVSLYGAVGHKQLIMQHAEVAPEDIVSSADDIVRSFNAITKLVELGVLNPLKKPDGTQGVGIAPAAVIIVIAAVVAISVIGWCIVATMKQIKVNKAIEQMCTEAARTGSKEDKERCASLVKMSLTATEGGPSIPPLTDFKNMAIAAAVVVGLVVLGPPIIRAFEARRPAT